MNPAITATLAITWSTLVGMVSGYYLRKLTHECPVRGPFVRVPPGAHLELTTTGGVELLEGFALAPGFTFRGGEFRNGNPDDDGSGS